MTTGGGSRANSILAETLDILQGVVKRESKPVTVERFVVGLFFTGVKLSNGRGGVCYTPIKDIPAAVCCPSSAKAMPQPGRLRGRNALELAREWLGGTPVQRAAGIAIMNALSSACLEQACLAQEGLEHFVLKCGDPLEDLQLTEDAYVVVVGALVPYLRLLKNRGRPFCVLEQDPATLKPDEMRFYAPAEQATEQVPRADVLVTTGTTLINGTLEKLLSLTRPDAHIIVVGPTASMLPHAFFRRGVNTVAGVRVTDPDALLDVLAEGGSGYHFFGKFVDKIRLTKSRLVLSPLAHDSPQKAS